MTAGFKVQSADKDNIRPMMSHMLCPKKIQIVEEHVENKRRKHTSSKRELMVRIRQVGRQHKKSKAKQNCAAKRSKTNEARPDVK